MCLRATRWCFRDFYRISCMFSSFLWVWAIHWSKQNHNMTPRTDSTTPKRQKNKFCDFITTETLRSRNCSILASSIWKKMTSKFANYSTLGYSRMSLRHHWVTFWVCRVIYKSRAIERTSNHTLTTRSCWAMTPPPRFEFRGGVWVQKKSLL